MRSNGRYLLTRSKCASDTLSFSIRQLAGRSCQTAAMSRKLRMGCSRGKADSAVERVKLRRTQSTASPSRGISRAPLGMVPVR